MDDAQPLQSTTVDELLTVLANHRCRRILWYFRESSTTVASVDDLVRALSDYTSEDESQLVVQLHHSALPRLDELGVLEYDSRSRTVRYWGNSAVESMMDAIAATIPQAVEA
ncbi:DUF7344 domain-containing protein [Natronorubrum daqingense]|uniref:DUF7344 domain-containing protein n=1 Tax=Natronorubrum daqingense TaxID=588898 RepID=A0A1N6ZWA7_9EURY|nr:hypothetical protein [Natronorubrum daqingense]APX95224.1 hypothetical protein BB347_00615 [Natronorubrum daqingense]SIR31087.1 hypothetical protein SAMN05421809_0941 [Natronorubrum daqingense]